MIDGEPQNEVGRKVLSGAVDYKKINDHVASLMEQGIVSTNIGIAKEPVPVVIKSFNKHAAKHGVTKQDAQGYIDDSVVMFDQGNRSLYVSEDGNAVLLDNERRVINAYPKDMFDQGIISILEVARNG